VVASRRVNVRLRDEIFERLETETARRGMTVSQVVQEALTRYFHGEGHHPETEIGYPISAQDNAQSYLGTPGRLTDGTEPPPRMTTPMLLQRIQARLRAQRQEEAHG
jgi:hypothetical protein